MEEAAPIEEGDRDPQDRPCRIFGYQLDISEQRKAKEDQGRLAAIVESSEDAIIGKTLEGIVTSWNEGARRLFGYTAEEMLGPPVSRIIPIERSEEEAQILARLRRGERVKHYEAVRRHKDGRLVNVFLTISPIRDGSGLAGHAVRARCAAPLLLALAATGLRALATALRSGSTSFCSVMSRAILEAPIMWPLLSRIGEMVRKTLTNRPSLCRRTVS